MQQLSHNQRHGYVILQLLGFLEMHLGAVQNRLEHTINNLGASQENLTAAESRIRDVDYDLAAA